MNIQRYVHKFKHISYKQLANEMLQVHLLGLIASYGSRTAPCYTQMLSSVSFPWPAILIIVREVN